jgi:thioesterase domain-containing protein
VTLFRADVTAAGHPEEPALGWDRLAAGGVEIEPIPGGHQDVVRPPGVRVVAEGLRARLEEAVSEAARRSEPVAG